MEDDNHCFDLPVRSALSTKQKPSATSDPVPTFPAEGTREDIGEFPLSTMEEAC